MMLYRRNRSGLPQMRQLILSGVPVIGKILFAAMCSVLAALFFWGARVQAAYRVQPVDETLVVVIDPGHGGENEGTAEGRLTLEDAALEKEMTLVTAKAMYDELCLYDNVEVYLTRTEDVDLSLKERAEFAASLGADFLFSIHYNASPSHDLFGSEVWISAETPFNAYGYQFGCIQLDTMGSMGLFLRGVKTRVNDSGKDYYGIIREASALNIPAVIIEHCHVDEERDIPFCSTREAWADLGRADALSVAKYFGLSSSALGVDYSGFSETLPEVKEHARVQQTLKDETPPDVCSVEFLDADYQTGELSVTVTAADYDSPLLYYDYSIDGGETYSVLYPWPGSNALEGTYTDTFALSLTIPSGVMPSVVVRAYNLFDVPAKSNCLMSLQEFWYGEEAEEQGAQSFAEPEKEQTDSPGTKTFLPASADALEQESPQSFLSFLMLCLLFVVLLFAVILTCQAVSLSLRRRKRRRRQRRKEEGDSRNHRK